MEGNEGNEGTDALIRRFARGAHGVVTRRELLRAGVHPRRIDRRVAAGRLLALHRGVYAVGHDQLRDEGRWLAAVLAYGEAAVLSHASALAAWELRPSPSVRIDVTVPTAAGVARRRGIRLFRHADLRRAEVTSHRGIRVTTVSRTLLDAATILDRPALRRAAEAAFRRYGITVAEMRMLLAVHPRRHGTRALRALVDDFDRYGATFTRSDLEAAMLQLCLDHRLPRPDVNGRADGREIDCRWPEHGLVVELDGYETHRGRAQFVADRARNRRHVLRGETIVVYTHHDVMREPKRVAREIAVLLRRLSC